MKNAIIMGFILHLWVSVAHGQTDATSLMKQADAAVKSGNTRKAQELYKKVLVLDPSMKQAYGALSIILLKGQDFGEAAKLLKRATARFPGYAEGWYNYAYSLRKTGRLKMALAAYKRFVVLKPQQADPHYGIGLTLKEMKQLSRAAASFRRYAQLEKRPNKKAWVKRALDLAVKLEGQISSGKTATTPPVAAPKLAAVAPKPAAAAPKPAAVAPKPAAVAPKPAAVAPKPAAVAPKPAAVASKPAAAPKTARVAPQGNSGLNRIKTAQSGEEPAALTAERRRARDHKKKADGLVRAGKAAQALVYYRRALAEDFSYTAAYNEYGSALFRLQRYDQAIRVFRVAIRDNPDYHLGWYNLAYALRKAGRLPEAIVAYRKYIALKPGDPDPFFGLGLAYKDSRNRRGAVAAFSDYIRHEHRDQQVRWVQKARAEIAKLEGQPPPTSIVGATPKPEGAAKSAPRSRAQLAREARAAAAEARKVKAAARKAARAEKRRLAQEARAAAAAARNVKAAENKAARVEKYRLAQEARAAAAAARNVKAAEHKAARAEKRRLAQEARAEAAAARKAKAAARKAARAEKRRLAKEARAARKAGKGAKDKVAVAAFIAPPTAQPLADVIEGPPLPEASGQVPKEVTGKWRVQADTLARREKCAQALPLYRKVLSRDPFSVRALDGLAYCTFHLKQYDSGARALGMGLRDNPDYFRGWLHLARLARGGGKHQRAAGLYRKYLRKVPGDHTGVFELARTLRGIGLRQQAAAEYRRYLAGDRRQGEDSRRVAAHQELQGLEGGGAAEGSGVSAAQTLLRTMGGSTAVDREGARAVQAPAKKLSPAELRAHKKRQAAEARRAKAAERKAKAAARKAARAEKRKLAAKARRAKAAERKARAAARKAARAEKRKLAAEARRIKAAERKARAAAARAARAEKRRLARRGKARRGGPGKHHPGPTLAASIDQDLADTASPAIISNLAHDLLRPAPEAAQELMAVADKQFAKKRYDVAMGIYQQAVQLDPAATEPLYKAGVAAVALGRMHLAADLFAQVMQLDPKNGTALINLKMARAAARETPPDAAYLAEATTRVRQQIESGRYAAAEGKLDQLIAEQVSAQLHMLRAEARLALGKAEEAIQDGGRALALNPGLLDVFRIMGQAHQQLNHPQKAIYYLRLYMDRGGDDPATKATREQVKQTLTELGHL